MRPLALGIALAVRAAPPPPETPRTILLRGHRQTLHLYGRAGGEPVLISSGGGGWIHLAPHIGELLMDRGQVRGLPGHDLPVVLDEGEDERRDGARRIR